MAAEINDNWYEDGVATFGDRLEAARAAAGLSAEDLAQRLGVRDTTIAEWEADAWEPRANRMQMLAGMLNVSLMWLMTGKGDGIAAPHLDANLSPAPNLGPHPALAEIVQLRQQMEVIAQKLRKAETRLLADSLDKNYDGNL